MAVCANDFKHSFCFRNMRKNPSTWISYLITPLDPSKSDQQQSGPKSRRYHRFCRTAKKPFGFAGVPFLLKSKVWLQQTGIPNCGKWSVSVQAVLGAWGYVKNPSATLTCITPSPSVTFWDTSMTQTLNNQSQLCQLTHVSRPASRWIRLFEKAGYKLTKCNRMEPDVWNQISWSHVWFHGLHREYSKAQAAVSGLRDQPKS